jgi:hypothetical protein
LADSGILSIPYLIAGGDLNLILTAEESWGGNFVQGATEDFFKNIFASNNLTDIVPAKLTPTWRNGRSGIDAISRRLDRFFVAAEYCSSPELPASWVEYPFFSDHAPIFLQLRSPDRLISPPFKFNHNWLTEVDYTDLVTTVWRDPIFLSEDNAQHRLFWKLQVLKARSKSWFHEKSNFEKARLVAQEAEICQIIKLSSTSSLSTDRRIDLSFWS